jgi:hypothetical protein
MAQPTGGAFPAAQADPDLGVAAYQATLSRDCGLDLLAPIPGILAIVVEYWKGRLRPFYAYQWLDVVDHAGVWCRAQIVPNDRRSPLPLYGGDLVQEQPFPVDDANVRVSFADWGYQWDQFLDLRVGSLDCTRVACHDTEVRYLDERLFTHTQILRTPSGLPPLRSHRPWYPVGDRVVHLRDSCETGRVTRIECLRPQQTWRCLLDLDSGGCRWVEMASSRLHPAKPCSLAGCACSALASPNACHLCGGATHSLV